MTTKTSSVEKVDKIVLEFKKLRDTKNTTLFEEKLGEQEWSDKSTAVGSLYVNRQALELIGMPEKIKVTIEPVK